ncbi:hypothetical protein K435DRAFT_776787 [Dendrothele bispora CBS 962.96]|uniref:Uncharacterized protein n=1 Tax=Dendrothele bispora (strain CBS 962.96) TaxID=1314807 RepID=A0A4V4HGS1_DENBC|nr:hypothetical protein K435DRAFT_776787 [Dendrothele bispora CBS 962.96]
MQSKRIHDAPLALRTPNQNCRPLRAYHPYKRILHVDHSLEPEHDHGELRIEDDGFLQAVSTLVIFALQQFSSVLFAILVSPCPKAHQSPTLYRSRYSNHSLNVNKTSCNDTKTWTRFLILGMLLSPGLNLNSVNSIGSWRSRISLSRSSFSSFSSTF